MENLTFNLRIFLPGIFLLCTNIYAQDYKDPVMQELLALDLSALGEQVYTANRELTSIEEAPSVVTLITAEQIERQGLKNLHEVLARVPGFFNATSPFMEPISNRGFVQNVNTNYLLLLDGHALNNHASNGIGHLHMMPGLDRIARIEIIRGPGSTLWGADAAMGIIHLITKKGADLDDGSQPMGALSLSADYEFQHDRQVLQLNYGKQFDDGDLLLSGNFFKSNADWTTSYQAGATDFEIQTVRQMNLWDFEDSHDLYAKLEWQDWHLKAGKIQFENWNPLFTFVDGSRETRWTSEKAWIEIGREHNLNRRFSLEWKLFHNDFTEQRFTTNPATTETNTALAKGHGGEAIIHFRHPQHHLLLGISASNMKMRNTTLQKFFTGPVNLFEAIPAITDKNRALFAEESYRGIDDWIFTLGFRLERNEPRSNSTNFMPRATVSHAINDNWRINYAYNTGYVAPTHEQSRGGLSQPFGTRYVQGAEDNQESASHDLQLFYLDERSRASLTLFHHTLSDVIQWSGFSPVTISGIPNVQLFEINTSDMVTWGLELEGETSLDDDLRLYGNYAYAHAEYQDRQINFQGQVVLDIVTGANIATDNLTVTGTPRHLWNIGLDWDIRDDLTLNAHYRGWTGAWAKNSNQPSFKKFGPYHYLDINLNHENFLTNGLQASAYVKNLFDNGDPLPGGVNSGQVEPQNGRQLGLKMVYQF